MSHHPGHDTEQQVSTAGGGWPRWNRNGKELFYLALDNTLMVTPMNGQTSRFDVGTGRPLFQIHPRPGRVDAYPYEGVAVNQLINVAVARMVTMSRRPSPPRQPLHVVRGRPPQPKPTPKRPPSR